ncbi:MAG: ribosome small subunit-dependent GTPase A [Promicromonosporaceae bacterium]|nr:ribosome small subunit-dependent GTPase A [Promicromonosporaceae bacterium]
MNATLLSYGLNPAMFVGHQGTPARVTAVHRDRYDVITEFGPRHARLKTSVYFGGGSPDAEMAFPTVGDAITLQYVEHEDSLITATLERKSYFSRRDPDKGRGEQAVAANFDYCLIVDSLNQNFSLRRIERYLAQAWDSGAVPVVVLTKADLVDDVQDQVRAAQGLANFADVIAVSTVTGVGLDRLSQYLQPGKTLVLLGSSGVGKSTLVNALAGAERMVTSEIREDDAKGRHTTTHRQLLILPGGGMIIDTPGMRELGMWDTGTGLSRAFADVETVLARGCWFSDCQHVSEPGCAVASAIVQGELAQGRWDSYLKLQREAQYADDRAAYAKKRAQAWKSWDREYRAATKEGIVKTIRR